MRGLGSSVVGGIAVLAAIAAAPAGAAPPVAPGRGPSHVPAKHAVQTGRGGAVTSVDPVATRAGIAVLRRGGNAVDAAVATAATLGVTEPYVAGIGGGGFFVAYLARRHRIVTIDGRETAPLAFGPDAFLDPGTGRPIPFYPQRVTTGLAVGVPGTLATWKRALDRYGRRSLAADLRPAIRAARRGFVVDRTFHQQTVMNAHRLRAFRSSRRLFLQAGRVPAVGSVLRNPRLARTYRLLARRGTAPFYHGRIGRAIVGAVTHPPLRGRRRLSFPVRPGLMTRTDLARYSAPIRRPTHVRYRGYDVYGMGPPSSGGSTTGEALNILEGFDLGGPHRALALHRYLEASRIAFADRNRFVADPDRVAVPLAGLLSQRFADARRCLIGPTALTSPVAPGHPRRRGHPAACATGTASAAPGTEGTSTNHVTVADGAGNVVSYTTTIEQIAGSAIAVPRYGFLLNNELTDFDPVQVEPGVPDPNLPGPGKRPRSSMNPTIVLRDRRPVLALGSPGGASIITTVLQVLLNRLDFGMSLPQAIAAPRASQTNTATTQAEPAFIARYGAALHDRFGQRFERAETGEIGAATGIEVLRGGRLQAAAEPVRRGGGDAEVLRPTRVATGLP